MKPDSGAVIKLDGVSMQYSMGDTSVNVLDGLSLSVGAGERVAITGPSGSGKTTLLLLLTGLETADNGSISINGARFDDMSPDARADLRREHIGIVFQSFHLIPTLTAGENVALPIEISGRPGSRSLALQMLEQVGLGARGNHYPSQLSGGEQQRVALARALVHQPSLIVADEPTGNLDEHTGEQIMALLFKLNREVGSTLLLVTHDPDLARRCDRNLRLHDGKLLDHTLERSGS